MSPFGKKLAAEFDAEFTRLANNWFLRWHALARGDPVEVDDFRGGVLRPSSTRFDAVAELAYWSALKRYIESKSDDSFARIEQEIGLLTGERAAQIAEEGAIALRSFLERLLRHAVFTEYRLQARGYPEERYLASRRQDSFLAEVQRRKVALLKRYGAMSWTERILDTIRGPARGQALKHAILVLTITGGIAALASYLGGIP